ncbi:MAG: aldo/keto reductase [Bacteroidales bacterium]|nr:aldo/keto reductase [Bacteroidales bacterium]
MQRIRIAPEGPEFSRISLGWMRLQEWHLNTAGLTRMIRKSIDLGLTTFDHADIYGSYTCEEVFGHALSETPSMRHEIEIVTKCGIKLISKNRPENTIHAYDTSKQYILWSAENSLKKLQTDYLDVLLVHRPDPLMDADEVAEAFYKLKEAGKVRHFGVSNFTTSQFDLLQSRLDFPLVTNQLEISVLHLNALFDGALDQCQQKRISPMAWSPIGGGRLFSGNSEKEMHVRNELQRIGEELGGAAPDQVALAWLLKHPSKIVPVLGTGNMKRIKAAKESIDLKLSTDQWFGILAASTGQEVP